MATMYFVADSANVTVMRTLASTAFGSYKLTPPEGIDVGDIYELSAPGNELGYVATLDSSRRVGGLARRFVRADVAVAAKDDTNPDWVPSSTVNEVLTSAARRVSSDFFLESDISKAGLGPWVPLVDFRVGDRANVDVWGQVVSLPVTRIEPVVSERDVVDWKVHLGGQLVADEDARLAENEALQKAFMKDRRELEGVSSTVSKVSKVATSAASGVKDLNETLAGPSATSDDVLSEMQALAEQLTEHGEDAPAGLIPAYMASNNERWRLQTEIDRIQDERLQEQEDMQEQIRDQLLEQVEANKSRVNVAFVSDYGCSHPDVEFTRLNPGWRAVIPSGSSMLQAEYYDMDEATMLEDGRANFLRPTENWFKPPSGENRIHEWTTANKTARFTWVSAPIRAGSSKVDGGSFSPARLSWVTRGEHTISPESEARQFAAVWTVRWAAVNRGSTYRARIVTSGGTVLAEWGSASIGPWSPLGDGRYTMRISCQNKAIPAGQDVRFQVYTSGGGESQRAINSTWSDATWIEDA
nr:hypothetical protein [Corynebacterium sp. UBA5992]